MRALRRYRRYLPSGTKGRCPLRVCSRTQLTGTPSIAATSCAVINESDVMRPVSRPRHRVHHPISSGFRHGLHPGPRDESRCFRERDRQRGPGTVIATATERANSNARDDEDSLHVLKTRMDVGRAAGTGSSAPPICAEPRSDRVKKRLLRGFQMCCLVGGGGASQCWRARPGSSPSQRARARADGIDSGPVNPAATR